MLLHPSFLHPWSPAHVPLQVQNSEFIDLKALHQGNFISCSSTETLSFTWSLNTCVLIPPTPVQALGYNNEWTGPVPALAEVYCLQCHISLQVLHVACKSDLRYLFFFFLSLSRLLVLQIKSKTPATHPPPLFFSLFPSLSPFNNTDLSKVSNSYC